MLETEELKDALNDMTIEDLSTIQAEIRYAKRKRYKIKGKFVQGYVGEQYRDAIPVVIDYLYDQKIIEEKTIYNLVKLSVEMVVEDVLSKIKNNLNVASTS